jgi:hypothetical protein
MGFSPWFLGCELFGVDETVQIGEGEGGNKRGEVLTGEIHNAGGERAIAQAVMK